MAEPLPLTDPTGTVRAYACGTCGRVDRSWPVAAQLDCTIEDAARESKRLASMCCVRCVACRGRWAHPGVCLDCERKGRRALAVLAAIGMAVAAGQLLVAAYPAVRQSYYRALWGPVAERAIAGLCGVDVETVRGW